MKYKLIIFDFDGTLADTFPWFLSVINDVADIYQFKKIEKKDEEIIRGFNAIRVLKFLGIPLWKIPMIASHVQTMMSNDIEKIKLFDGVSSLLHTLSEHGIVTGVVSSNNNKNVSRVLGIEHVALIKYFKCGVSLFGKESKLKNILSASGLNGEEVLFIGDEVRDIEAARKVKINSGAVTWGYNNSEVLKESVPDIIFESMDEMLGRLL